jgi:hypothetical protein
MEGMAISSESGLTPVAEDGVDLLIENAVISAGKSSFVGLMRPSIELFHLQLHLHYHYVFYKFGTSNYLTPMNKRNTLRQNSHTHVSLSTAGAFFLQQTLR